MSIDLNDDEVTLILEALDRHRYWQLSDLRYRNSGYVLDPGSDDPDSAESIQAVDALEAKLGAARAP